MSGKASTINAKHKIINSGFCAGNKSVLTVLQHIYSMNVPLERCKGTVRLYNAEWGGKPVNIGKYHNSGAFSGNEQCGVVGEESWAFGTLQSFNAGLLPGTYCCLEESISDPNLKKILEESFFGGTPSEEMAVVDREDNWRRRYDVNAGTRFSFNSVGENSSIDMEYAIINSGYCSGNFNVLLNEYNHNFPSECKGTKESFNSIRSYKIDLNHAHINSGGYAGNSK